MTIVELLEKKKQIDRKITEERKKPSGIRDRVKIRKLQGDHHACTQELARAHEDDGVTAKDKKDDSEKGFKEKEARESQKKKDDWEKKHSESSKRHD